MNQLTILQYVSKRNNFDKNLCITSHSICSLNISVFLNISLIATVNAAFLSQLEAEHAELMARSADLKDIRERAERVCAQRARACRASRLVPASFFSFSRWLTARCSPDWLSGMGRPPPRQPVRAAAPLVP